MPNYTIELRQVIDEGHALFDFPYEFYDEDKRYEFECHFVKHFYFREICTDSIERFLWLLEDKMNTAFPYYNELFKAADIEYSVLNNYNMTETTTISRDSEGKNVGVVSQIGQTEDTQSGTSKDTRVGTRSETVEGESALKKTGTDSVTTDTTVTDESSSTEVNSGDTTTNGVARKKFLDTPQGQVDLDDPKYLTNLGQDETEGSSSVNGEKSSSGMGTNRTVGDVVTTHNTNDLGTTKDESHGEENVTQNGETTFTSQQSVRSDHNTRDYMSGSMKEVMEHKRIGNIGIDTDSDMITKHIKLQKVLTQIERMFFDECEDLFMMVW